MRVVPARRAAWSLAASLIAPVVFAGACDGGTAPEIAFSVALADGRTCRDASVTTLVVAHGGDALADDLCEHAEPPGVLRASGLPLNDEIEVFGDSAGGAHLYRGTLVAAELLGRPATIELYPFAAR